MLLEIRNLEVTIKTLRGVLPAVRGIDLDVGEGEILGLVGESGCGKSTAMHAIARIGPKNAEVRADRITLDGRDVSKLTGKDLESVRGSGVAYIFQDPQASLNPIMTVGDQIVETLKVKRPAEKDETLLAEAKRLLEAVKIKEPEMRLKSYPHEMSGGMKQRVMIAMAIANSPKLLIADEPTTSLDVTIQSEIIQLFHSINREKGTSIVFITHDLAVAAKICDRIAVMYAGKIAEVDTTEGILRRPRHPYTVSLWNSIPRIEGGQDRLQVIPGTIPNPMNLPGGCAFHPRCPNAVPECREAQPPVTVEGTKLYACCRPFDGTPEKH